MTRSSSAFSLPAGARHALFAAVLAAATACGGVTAVDPIGAPQTTSTPAPGDTAAPGAPRSTDTIPAPATGPYTGLVGTTDVSILYPLPEHGTAGMIAPSEIGNYGALLPEAMVDTVTGGGPLDRTGNVPNLGYAELRLVGLRLDPCSARKAGACTSEVRAVFQALYEKTAGDEGDPSSGTAATDGALHVVYDVPESELVGMAKEILFLKGKNGDLALHELAPHPILAAQGLEGAFAAGLRNIVLFHLGGARIGRITAFDHNFEPDSDGWNFTTYDRGEGDVLVSKQIPKIGTSVQVVSGSSLGDSHSIPSAEVRFGEVAPDSIVALVRSGRPEAGTPGAAALAPVFEAALRIQNPNVHTAESIDCGNCHVAEGARLVGKTEYAFPETGAFTHTRSLAYRRDLRAVTNLHAFSYLRRHVSIMQRTANESVLVAEWMEARFK